MAKSSEFYGESFYKQQQDGSTKSALGVIPKVLDIFKPQSVMDIGCGVGTWLSVFKGTFNVNEILGVDGEYVDKNMLKIDKSEFVSYDLEKVYNAPKKFDLAICMEVGEHLPEKCSDNLVQSLTNSSDFILFSAALPGQTGTYHINEQYPEYWAKKFIDRGYVCIDHIRKQVWNDKNIDVWYRQNALLFIKKELYDSKFKQQLGPSLERTDPEFLTRIHPELYHYVQSKFYQTRSLTGFLRYHLFPLKKALTGKK